jgi:antitoxin VapB
MHTTKIIQRGDSQAILIPSDLAYENTDIVFEIERVGDELRVRPKSMHHSLARTLGKFAQFESDFLVEGRGDQEQIDRTEE